MHDNTRVNVFSRLCLCRHDAIALWWNGTAAIISNTMAAAWREHRQQQSLVRGQRLNSTQSALQLSMRTATAIQEHQEHATQVNCVLVPRPSHHAHKVVRAALRDCVMYIFAMCNAAVCDQSVHRCGAVSW